MQAPLATAPAAAAPPACGAGCCLRGADDGWVWSPSRFAAARPCSAPKHCTSANTESQPHLHTPDSTCTHAHARTRTRTTHDALTRPPARTHLIGGAHEWHLWALLPGRSKHSTILFKTRRSEGALLVLKPSAALKTRACRPCCTHRGFRSQLICTFPRFVGWVPCPVPPAPVPRHGRTAPSRAPLRPVLPPGRWRGG
ncbi:MAG: hypothetical protein J3K34DRAFT_426264 [Monoraphidium minutum]|nr:MAG: hypothetical protein J3K34DRAFT_426264 [Monoraphidium minutum]